MDLPIGKPDINLPFGDNEEELTTSEILGKDVDSLITPLPPDVILEAHEIANEQYLQESDENLAHLLDNVQRYVQNQKYQDKPGNAFFESLVADFNDRKSLREPILIRDGEFFFTILASGYTEIGEEMDMNLNEIKAVRDAHHLYAEQAGLSEYSTTVCVMCVGARNELLADIHRHIDHKRSNVEMDVTDPQIASQIDDQAGAPSA